MRKAPRGVSAGRLEEEIRAVLEQWNRSVVEKDEAIARQLRLDEYSAAVNGVVLTKEEELARIGSPEIRLDAIQLTAFEVHGDDREATAVCSVLLEGTSYGEPLNAAYDLRVTFVQQAGGWRARSSTAMSTPMHTLPAGRSAASRLGRVVPSRLKVWLQRTVRPLGATLAPSFQKLAYKPYKPGLDFVIAPPDGSSAAPNEVLPIPPPHLRLMHNLHGQVHVERMRQIVHASGFTFEPHGRILDFGCGAGRMIRHLRDLSDTCEIWGTDISAEHIYWCKQNLSPPFHFATTTKVPHLPFEDRSFQFIYCGSVFTHIDDLADAWLLELRRILAPGGRLYLTIHDNHTVALFESGRYDAADIVTEMKSSAIYQEAKHAFGMFTIGRDNTSQVFYDLDYFSKSLRSIFEILSITREAYFYQTAILLTRKSP